jgi:hypothetical protein
MMIRVLGRKSRILIAVSLVLMLAISVSAYNVSTNLKNYRALLQNEAPSSQVKSYEESVRDNLQLALNISSFPGIAQLLNLVNLNFSSIEGELLSAVEIAPAILANPKPLKYLVAIQNSAEARGTGGILGAYAIVEFYKGSVKVIKTGSNEPLYGTSLKKIPVDVPVEFLNLYGNNPAIIQNSNLSPHFPYGAEIWLGLWKEEFGEDLDGVIAVDPTALSYVLRATGPITLADGEQITSQNVVAETLEVAYKRYENDNKARKQHLVDIMDAVSAKLNSGGYSKVKMAQALRDGIIANRILVYSANQDVQAKLSKVRLGGYMSLGRNNEFRAVIQNIDAGKLDYYLDRSVEIKSQSCERVRETQVKVRVTNTLKNASGLSAYVLTRADKGKPESLVPGSHRFKVFIYGPVGAEVVSVSRENRTANLGGASTERKRPIYVVDVDLVPGQSEELLANFSGGTGKISFIDQPLVRTTRVSISDNC